MDATTKCLEVLDFAADWKDWRKGLKKTIYSSRSYYEDETVQILLTKLNSFLNKQVCVSSNEEKLIQDMWEVADNNERKTITTILLKTASRL
jgi:hypothetical protein